MLSNSRSKPEVMRSFEKAGLSVPNSLQDFINVPFANLQLGDLLGNHQLKSGKAVVDSDLEYAKHLLTTLNVNIGITERYSESLRIFETVTGKRIPNRIIEIKNQNPSRSAATKVNEQTRKQIREKNHLSQQLYEYALQRFEEQFAACGEPTDAPITFKTGETRVTNGNSG